MNFGDMLIGEFETKKTSNNRIAFPKKFRDELGDQLILMNGYEGCLIIVDKSQFIALTKDITEGRFINDSVRDMTRFLVGTAQEISLDKQGRFVLPQSLIEYAGILENVIFLGLYKWIEIWDKSKWIDRKNYIIKNSSTITKDLENSLNKIN